MRISKNYINYLMDTQVDGLNTQKSYLRYEILILNTLEERF